MKPTPQYRLLCSLALLVSLLGTEAQTAPEVPRLVVSVVVDQLRSDYLHAFMPLYGEEGFRRIMREGRVYRHAEYPFAHPDRASAMACLATGTTPYENGIVGQRWLSRQTLQPQFCVGEGTPALMAVSTLGDELKLSTDGRALVFSVAPDVDAAVLAGGHAADGAFWMDNESGQWSTSDYYTRPLWLATYNRGDHAAERIGKLSWTPVDNRFTDFSYFTVDEKKRFFQHRFRGDRNFRQFKASGLVNEEVSDFVDFCMQNTQLGSDDVTDFLAVSYYAGNFDHQPVTDYPMELQDTYVRLDDQIGRMMQRVEQKVGQGRVLFVLTSSGHCDPERSDLDLKRYRIPTGEFNITRAQGLLNMYLSALYGQAQYIEGSIGNQLYFDIKGIEQRSLKFGELLERSSEFLMQLSGVRDVYSSARLNQQAWTPAISALRNAYSPRHSGDIMVQVTPGWTLVNEQTGEKRLQRESYVEFPLMFCGMNIEPRQLEEPVTVDRVAPTLARYMRIRAPNACSAAPLTNIQ